jgi:hypothetical protein
LQIGVLGIGGAMLAVGCLIPLLLGVGGGVAGVLIAGTHAGVVGAIAGVVVGAVLMLVMLWGWEKIRTPPE